MPKLKTKKSLVKRIKLTKNGKMLRRHIQTSHLRSGESVGTKSRKGKLTTFSTAFEKKLRQLI